MKNRSTVRRILFAAVVLTAAVGEAAEIEVGPTKAYRRIEEALKAAAAGDTITVHPLPEGGAYTRVALSIDKPSLTIRAAPAQRRIVLSGDGFDYSGRGSTPRAIVQFNRGADGCLIEGFELTGAHNRSHNGAGIRINQANEITVRNCVIHGNDMGIMSNGDGTAAAGRGQLIERSLIHGNGSLADPGYNHNLYLGGESVTLLACEIHSSLTGHNVKSRARRTVLHACYIHSSANREVDLVDHPGDTVRPGSDAYIAGCVIVKDAGCRGNRGVIHFGEDIGGDRRGTLHLANSVIVTPFISPVVQLSAPGGSARIYNSILCDGGAGRGNQVVVRHDIKLVNPRPVEISHNWLSHGFPGATAAKGVSPPFADPSSGDYRIPGGFNEFLKHRMPLPEELLHALGGRLMHYRHPLNTQSELGCVIPGVH